MGKFENGIWVAVHVSSAYLVMRISLPVQAL